MYCTVSSFDNVCLDTFLGTVMHRPSRRNIRFAFEKQEKRAENVGNQKHSGIAGYVSHALLAATENFERFTSALKKHATRKTSDTKPHEVIALLSTPTLPVLKNDTITGRKRRTGEKASSPASGLAADQAPSKHIRAYGRDREVRLRGTESRKVENGHWKSGPAVGLKK